MTNTSAPNLPTREFLNGERARKANFARNGKIILGDVRQMHPALVLLGWPDALCASRPEESLSHDRLGALVELKHDDEEFLILKRRLTSYMNQCKMEVNKLPVLALQWLNTPEGYVFVPATRSVLIFF